MVMEKKNIGILFGGKSAEHEVSINSARSIFRAIDKEKYVPILVFISKKGNWFADDGFASAFLSDEKNISFQEDGEEVVLAPQSEGLLRMLSNSAKAIKLDVVFPVLHGTYAEDGTVQGLLKLADVPFVGSGVLGSAISMDKEIMKKLLKEAKIRIGKFITVRSRKEVVKYEEVVEKIGCPFFVKPANMGSSVGVNKVSSEKDYREAVDDAFHFDNKILLEEYLEGREIECSVLGNENPRASIAGEIIPAHEFYSYDAKYKDENGATLEIPAKITTKEMEEVKDLSVKVFKTLSCEGLGRVDFFLKKDGVIFVNEINTLPGFTNISMYPKLWEASGISYKELIDKLIILAEERFTKEKNIKTDYDK